MKISLSFPRVALTALAMGFVTVPAIYADDATAPSTTTTPAPTCNKTAWHHHRDAAVLTDDEKAQLKKAHESALAANPSLQTQDATLKQQFESLKSEGKGVATKDQWQALHQQETAYHQQLRTAELAVDPTLAPIFAKLDAAKASHHHRTT